MGESDTGWERGEALLATDSSVFDGTGERLPILRAMFASLTNIPPLGVLPCEAA